MGAVRGQSTLLVVGLLALSVALARYRSGAALGLAALKPTLPALWAIWLLADRHWRAIGTALAVLAALVGLSLVVVGPTAVAAYPEHLLGVARADAVGVHVNEMVNWRGAAARLGAGAWLTWVGMALTVVVLALAWARRPPRALAAAAAFLATPLVIPHANQHEAILAGLGVLLVLVAAWDHPVRARLTVAAVLTHAALWAGPVLGGETSAWLLFGLTLGWFLIAVWLTRFPGSASLSR
jgi:hypothetical protein